jgi:hypothetical protein
MVNVKNAGAQTPVTPVANTATANTPAPAPAKVTGAAVTLTAGTNLQAGVYNVKGWAFTLPALAGNYGVQKATNCGWPQIGICQGSLGKLPKHTGTPRANSGHYVVNSICGNAILFVVHCQHPGCGWALVVYGPGYFKALGFGK